MVTTLPTLFTRLSPALVGFDELFRQLENFDNASNNYPPHNLLKISENEWLIELAVAGFAKEDLSVTMHYGLLAVEATKPEEKENQVFLHKGISSRSFKKTWRLNEYVDVASVEMRDGILKIRLTRNIPESEKPKQIPIT
jgi:molecular chaperone IbpA